MLARITGLLESLHGNAALVVLGDGAAYQVLVPAYLADRLSGKWAGTGAGSVGQVVTLQTLQYLEGLNQGSSFIPRLIGFGTPGEREFFELLTTVKGLGNKRALRAMVSEPATIARAIHDRDTRALQRLPEIGPKLAELIVHELKGKVGEYVSMAAAGTGGGGPVTTAPETGRVVAPSPEVEPKPAGKPRVRLSAGASPTSPTSAAAPAALPPVRETVEALIALGESPVDAERMVARAVDRARAANLPVPVETRALLTAAYAAR